MSNPTKSPAIVQRPTWGDAGVSPVKVLLVGAASTVLNGGIIALFATLFMLLGVTNASGESLTPEIKQNNEIEEAPAERDLTITDIGLDSTKELNYFVDRIEDISVPGPVDPTAEVGIVNAPEAAPTNVPPPPGSGGGTGGAPLDPNQSGIGSMAGTIGGMGGVYSPGGFAGRSGATRKKMLAEGGGTSASEAAVGLGLKFLAQHQAPDGSWSLNNFGRNYRTAPYMTAARKAAVAKEVRERIQEQFKGKLPAMQREFDEKLKKALDEAMGLARPYNADANTTRNNNTAGTAFGLLPFLAAGITSKPSKDNVNKVDYSHGVSMAIKWLINQQVKSGTERGYYGGDQYSHGLATIAMCEAYGLTSDPQIKASAQMAINYIVAAQGQGGGWRYTPRSDGDTSVTGWMLMALKSGQMAGLSVPKSTLTKVSAYLDSCESSDKGGYGYVPGSGPSPAMTAVGALCRQYLGVSPRNPSLQASIRKLKERGNEPSNPNIYYVYYATQVFHHMGGETWNYWNLGPSGTGKDGIREILIARQDKGVGGKPGQAGSYKGDDHVGGRLGATSLSLLCLEVYYRHLPLYRREAGVVKPEK
jgi:hypothetical protein